MGEGGSIVHCDTCGVAMIVSAAVFADAPRDTGWICNRCEEKADLFSQWGNATAGEWGGSSWFVPTRKGK